MEIIYKASDLRTCLKDKHTNMSVGFVPTMGYLHQGHLSLIERAKSENDLVVTSVFVNPTQFGPGEDFETYPRDLETDMKLAEAAGSDIFFHPDSQEIYPGDSSTFVEIQGNIVSCLCGGARPGHFRGVTTVVSKLFNIVKPTNAYFGAKDAQQVAVIKKMVKELFFDINIIECPTVREPDGLAKSSRNTNLSAEERSQAPLIYKALKKVEDQFSQGSCSTTELLKTLREGLDEITLGQPDYVDILDKETFAKTDEIGSEALVAVAVKFKNARLIDNITLKREVK
jgi:pantoate--beta-alanine ligase